MKTTSILVSLMMAFSATAAPRFGKGFNGQGGGRKGAGNNGNGVGNGGFGNNGNNNAGGGAAAGNNNNAGGGAAAGGKNNGGGGGNVNAQTSLTLNPAVIAKGFAKDGQDVPTAGQVASLTSTNNFINFCLTVPNLPITDGKQIQSGSCNPAPIGAIPSVDNMPSCKFVSPVNNANIAPNTPFPITMAIKNLQTGNFVNAQANYFAAPQQVNPGSGQIIGHSHVTIDPLDSMGSTKPTNPKNFVFFKGINDAAVNGQVTVTVDKGLPAGAYRLCSINSSANHQPVIVAVAQHGSLDDCVYFTVGGRAGGNAGAGAGGNAGSGAGTGNRGTNRGGQAGAGGGRGGNGRGRNGN